MHKNENTWFIKTQNMLNNFKYIYLHLCIEAVAIFFPLRMEWSNRIFFPFSQDYHLQYLY